MANEITIQAALSLQRDIISVQASATKLNTQTGTRGLMTQISVSNVTGAGAVKVIDTTTPPLSSIGYLFLKNLDATLSCDVSRDNTFASGSLFVQLKPSEFCLIPVNQATVPTIVIRASGAGPISVLVCAAEI